MQNVGVTRAASYEYGLVAVVVSFHCDVISCQLSRRGVRRGAAEAAAQSSACGRGNAVGVTSIMDRGKFFLVKVATVGLQLPLLYRNEYLNYKSVKQLFGFPCLCTGPQPLKF